MELQKLIIAGDDLSEILGIKDPPINTAFVFESKARGAAFNAAKAKAEKEFMAALTNEIKEVIEFKDDSGNYDLQAGDIPRLKAETKEVIIEISADTAERLKEVLAPPAAAKNKKSAPTAKGGGGGRVASEEVSKRKTLIEDLISQAAFTKKQILEKVLKEFPKSSESAISTMITDGKNPKYNKFSKLVQEKDKILSF